MTEPRPMLAVKGVVIQARYPDGTLAPAWRAAIIVDDQAVYTGPVRDTEAEADKDCERAWKEIAKMGAEPGHAFIEEKQGPTQ